MFAPRNSSPTAIYGKEDVAAYEVKVVHFAERNGKPSVPFQLSF